MIILKKITKRVLGIDYGIARIGLAISDETQTIATPLQTVQTEKNSDQAIKKLLECILQVQKDYSCEIVEIVIGFPLMMSGKIGLVADAVNIFVEKLSEKTQIPIKKWDERLTTVQAERSLRESEMSRKKRSKVVDIVSAAIILQSYLDHIKLKNDFIENQFI